jgi:hypothetical protein
VIGTRIYNFFSILINALVSFFYLFLSMYISVFYNTVIPEQYRCGNFRLETISIFVQLCKVRKDDHPNSAEHEFGNCMKTLNKTIR